MLAWRVFSLIATPNVLRRRPPHSRLQHKVWTLFGIVTSGEYLSLSRTRKTVSDFQTGYDKGRRDVRVHRVLRGFFFFFQKRIFLMRSPDQINQTILRNKTTKTSVCANKNIQLHSTFSRVTTRLKSSNHKNKTQYTHKTGIYFADNTDPRSLCRTTNVS